MTKETNDDVVQNIAELSDTEKGEAWASWVRSEVNSALDVYLEKSKSGHINVKYYPHIVEQLESGPQTDDTKADGVQLTVILEFEKPIDLQKPRVEDNEVETEAKTDQE